MEGQGARPSSSPTIEGCRVAEPAPRAQHNSGAQQGQSVMPNSPSIGYWTCVRCSLFVLHNMVEVDIDDFGCYFLCAGCGRRNELRCVPGPTDEPSVFVQVTT